MKFHTQFFDLQVYLDRQLQPAVVLPRGRRQAAKLPSEAISYESDIGLESKIWVPAGPISSGVDPEWKFSTRDEAVITHFHAYLTPDDVQQDVEAVLWAMGVETGLLALSSLAEVTSEIPQTVYVFCGQKCRFKRKRLQALLALAIQVQKGP